MIVTSYASSFVHGQATATCITPWPPALTRASWRGRLPSSEIQKNVAAETIRGSSSVREPSSSSFPGRR